MKLAESSGWVVVSTDGIRPYFCTERCSSKENAIDEFLRDYTSAYCEMRCKFPEAHSLIRSAFWKMLKEKTKVRLSRAVQKEIP